MGNCVGEYAVANLLLLPPLFSIPLSFSIRLPNPQLRGISALKIRQNIRQLWPDRILYAGRAIIHVFGYKMPVPSLLPVQRGPKGSVQQK